MAKAGFTLDQIAQEIASRTLKVTSERDDSPFRNAIKNIVHNIEAGNNLLSGRGRARVFGPLEGVEPIFSISPPDQIEEFTKRCLSIVGHWMRGDADGWPGSVFHGDLGVGKTGTAIQIARYVNAVEGWHCRVEKLWKILDRMKSVNHREEGELGEIEIVREYCRPELLVLDEIGVQPGTQSDNRIIYEVLDSRYEKLKPTIITTNHNLDTPEGKEAFISCFGIRTADRFTGCKMKFEGRNLRGKI